jgi:LDH2 family malate/lactate/ureidoglycolate dehydrogenase
VLVPGEIERGKMEKQRRVGIGIDDAVLAMLEKYAASA